MATSILIVLYGLAFLVIGIYLPDWTFFYQYLKIFCFINAGLLSVGGVWVYIKKN